MMKTRACISLTVNVSDSRLTMGEMAAHRLIDTIQAALNMQEQLRMVFAAAPSQNEFLAELTRSQAVEWRRITAFHMDEYLGLPDGAPQLFSVYLDKHLFSKVRFKAVHRIDPRPLDPLKECRRYAELLKEAPIDIVCMGIGENGHIAFNDPPVADFGDPDPVKVVQLDQKCRQQQVNDGAFPAIQFVPEKAVTLTVPTLMSARYLSVVVPGPRKAEAVRATLYDEVSTRCPASILRTHKNTAMFLDTESASLLQKIR